MAADRAPVLVRDTVWSWITTVDHKRIGILYFFTSLSFFLVGGLLALLVRTQLIVPNNTFLAPDHYNQIFTMHGLVMIFLALMPMAAAFFNYFIPLLIGARDVAFPRLNAFSYWTYLFGGLLLVSSFLFNAAPNFGWTGYANLSGPEFTGLNGDFYVASLLVLGVSSTASSLNFLVTIINMRAPGMTWMRLPLFPWLTFITAILILLAFPPLTVGMLLLTFDRYFGATFFMPDAGGDVVLYQHLFWIFGHPEVYIMILPAWGIVSQIVPTFSRKPLFGYPFMVYSGISIAFLSFGVWAHHMFAVGLGPVPESSFGLMSMLIAIPTGVKIFNWLGTLWGGSITVTTPLLFSVGFISMFTIGGISGVMHAAVPIDYWQHDSYFIVAHIHYVLFGGTMFVLLGAIYYWFPKMFGRMLNDRLGRIQFWLTLIGFNITFFPMHFLGIDGMPRRVYTYPDGMGWDLWNMVETIGAYMLGLSVLIMVYNILVSLRHGAQAPADPWDGRSLEWSIPSPPPAYNFAVIPTVHSREAYWDFKHRSGPSVEAEQNINPGPSVARGIHMPPPSYWPILAASGLALAGAGLVVRPLAIIPGLALLIVSLHGWAYEPIHPDEQP